MMKNLKPCFFIFFLFTVVATQAQVKILFDASKAEAAGNADWIIDADIHDISYSSGNPVAGNGTESNPQRFPTPLQSTITATTPETYWNGALSNWGIDCVKQGYLVETLPFDGQITYGLSTNPQDLSHYKVFIVDEPNSAFTATEKTAILSFVQNGGGLCIISDHTISDRNNDGIDSPQVLNDLMSNNTVQNNAFGIAFNYTDISQTSSVIANLPNNPVLHGTAGNVSQVKWSNGTTMTINTAQNSSVTGLVFKTGSTTTNTTNIMCASATFGTGKVVAIGDSSIADDGSGDPGDTLYNGYIDDANGNHQRLLMNAVNWLATTSPLSAGDLAGTDINAVIAPNPIKDHELKFQVFSADSSVITITLYDVSGRELRSKTMASAASQTYSLSLQKLNPGVYFCHIKTDSGSKTMRFVLL